MPKAKVTNDARPVTSAAGGASRPPVKVNPGGTPVWYKVIMFGLMILAAAAGMRRGSGLSRLLVSVYLVIVVGLTVLVLADSRLSNLWATGVAVIGVVAIVLPWLPPASRFLSRLRDSSMTA